ncbi:MAG: hypothetical protein AAF560_15210 [Acidobacteriota bacterium]
MDSIEAGGDVIVAGEIGTVNLQGRPILIGGAVANRPGGSAAIATIHCQEFIIRQYTGVDVPADALIAQARANGWYHDGSDARPDDVGKLLELHGIPTRRYAAASPRQLATELGSGHSVIVGVDRPNPEKPHPMLEDIRQRLGLGTADPVVVSRVDSGAPGAEEVVVVAPGQRGAAIRYPMKPFLGAWKDRGFTMMATQGPPPIKLRLGFEFESASRREHGTGGLIKIPEIEGYTVPSRRAVPLLEPRERGEDRTSDGASDRASDRDEMPSGTDPSPRGQSLQAPLQTPLEEGLREPYVPLAYDPDDPLDADHEGELLDGDGPGEDGGYDFG